jgi:hypothetical protein
MRRVLLVLVAAMSVVLSLGTAVASAAHASTHKRATLTIRGIDQNGKPELIGSGYLFESDGWPVSSVITGSYRLPVGRYCIAVIVPTMVDGQHVADTIVVRDVTLRHNTTVTMSAQGSVPVDVSLDGTAVTDLSAGVSIVTGRYAPTVVMSDGQTAYLPLYVEPYRARNLEFGYAASYQGLGGATSYLAGSSADGIPVKPGGSFTSAHLAAVLVGAAGGTLRPWAGHAVLLDYTGPGGMTASQQITDGSAVTDFFSPGPWELDASPLIPDGSALEDSWNARFAARQSYTKTFFSAAYGPELAGDGQIYVGNGFMTDNGAAVGLALANFFADPNAEYGSGADPAARAVVTLSTRGKVVKRSRYDGLNLARFDADGPRSGWYTLTVNATRTGSSTLLSPKVTSTWRFYAPGDATSQQEYPLSFASLRPQGLGIDNQAAGASTTIVDVKESTNYLGPGRLPRADDWRSVTVQVSFNDGVTWHSVKTYRRSGGEMSAIISNPASGFASLRVTAVNRDGESAQQTIYKAYAIG